MINFEEELKKFHPSLEIDEAEDVIINHNLTEFHGHSGGNGQGAGRRDQKTATRPNTKNKGVKLCSAIIVAQI